MIMWQNNFLPPTSERPLKYILKYFHSNLTCSLKIVVTELENGQSYMKFYRCTSILITGYDGLKENCSYRLKYLNV